MKNYSLILSDHIPEETQIDVYELCKNKESLFQSFFEEIEKDGNLFGNLAGAIRIIQELQICSEDQKLNFGK